MKTQNLLIIFFLVACGMHEKESGALNKELREFYKEKGGKYSEWFSKGNLNDISENLLSNGYRGSLKEKDYKEIFMKSIPSKEKILERLKEEAGKDLYSLKPITGELFTISNKAIFIKKIDSIISNRNLDKSHTEEDINRMITQFVTCWYDIIDKLLKNGNIRLELGQEDNGTPKFAKLPEREAEITLLGRKLYNIFTTKQEGAQGKDKFQILSQILREAITKKEGVLIQTEAKVFHQKDLYDQKNGIAISSTLSKYETKIKHAEQVERQFCRYAKRTKRLNFITAFFISLLGLREDYILEKGVLFKPNNKTLLDKVLNPPIEGIEHISHKAT